MSEGKALTLVVIGTGILSVLVDIVLLKAHAGGEALAVGMVVVLSLTSVVTNVVMRHYEALKLRRKREAALLR